MQEYLSEAVVLDRLPNGDLNGRVVFLTKRFGKLVGRARSIRKITSKLSGHLQPGNLVQLRMIEKNGLQVVDALKKSRLRSLSYGGQARNSLSSSYGGQARNSLSLAELRFLGELLAEAEPEFAIWEMLVTGRFSWNTALKMLGWDPDFASCAVCPGTADVFHPRTQEFFCKDCASKLRSDEVIYLGTMTNN
ncbi:DNA repair protein RecO [Nocardioides sp.]|uniref:DNA repair protein RecO n=1 Tax=Nocardioides sp. TaxID=35761 RepID=UPI00273405A1|nr:recombination protein O N-terminal domain-containing protein [Nocardioides sp.]MDP3894270.1 recombination protein O N-terminal domain-containing protein [Nocardioides sp.]